MAEKEFTITVYTENITGLLARVVSIFSRRHINIESITASKSSVPDIHRYTMVVNVTQEMVEKLVAQIDKQIDVLKAFYYEEDEIVYQEVALYKVPTNSLTQSNKVEKLIRSHNARILEIESEYVVIEKTGHQSETEALLRDLEPTGIFEFARSGRVAIVKPMERLNNYLKSVEKEVVDEETPKT